MPSLSQKSFFFNSYEKLKCLDVLNNSEKIQVSDCWASICIYLVRVCQDKLGCVGVVGDPQNSAVYK